MKYACGMFLPSISRFSNAGAYSTRRKVGIDGRTVCQEKWDCGPLLVTYAHDPASPELMEGSISV